MSAANNAGRPTADSEARFNIRADPIGAERTGYARFITPAGRAGRRNQGAGRAAANCAARGARAAIVVSVFQMLRKLYVLAGRPAGRSDSIERLSRRWEASGSANCRPCRPAVPR